MSPSLIAFHLPQYHQIPENDKWWGVGFTEWVNTKRAKKLYKTHYQPKTPLDNHYYDLSKIEDLKWQMDLAREYGLDGFCYYHYWFNGKMLLEKPMEIMRGLDERLPYMFCWANEPWTRSWDGKKDVLIDQVYSGVKDWAAHFDYFIRFFLDERYIKIDNRPVLVLYRTSSISECDKMIDYWNNRCKEYGFSGIYCIEEKNGFQSACMSQKTLGYLEFEPLYTSWRLGAVNKLADKLLSAAFNVLHGTKVKIHSYKRYWNCIVNRERKVDCNKSISIGAFVDWDNTARKGANGSFFYGASPKVFEEYMKKQLEIAKKLNSPFVFINAWNEWGEGAYLEPDTLHGLEYLEALKLLKQ